MSTAPAILPERAPQPNRFGCYRPGGLESRGSAAASSRLSAVRPRASVVEPLLPNDVAASTVTTVPSSCSKETTRTPSPSPTRASMPSYVRGSSFGTGAPGTPWIAFQCGPIMNCRSPPSFQSSLVPKSLPEPEKPAPSYSCRVPYADRCSASTSRHCPMSGFAAFICMRYCWNGSCGFFLWWRGPSGLAVGSVAELGPAYGTSEALGV